MQWQQLSSGEGKVCVFLLQRDLWGGFNDKSRSDREQYVCGGVRGVPISHIGLITHLNCVKVSVAECLAGNTVRTCDPRLNDTRYFTSSSRPDSDRYYSSVIVIEEANLRMVVNLLIK